jgi:hypothetical protein
MGNSISGMPSRGNIMPNSPAGLVGNHPNQQQRFGMHPQQHMHQHQQASLINSTGGIVQSSIRPNQNIYNGQGIFNSQRGSMTGGSMLNNQSSLMGNRPPMLPSGSSNSQGLIQMRPAMSTTQMINQNQMGNPAGLVNAQNRMTGGVPLNNLAQQPNVSAMMHQQSQAQQRQEWDRTNINQSHPMINNYGGAAAIATPAGPTGIIPNNSVMSMNPVAAAVNQRNNSIMPTGAPGTPIHHQQFQYGIGMHQNPVASGAATANGLIPQGQPHQSVGGYGAGLLQQPHQQQPAYQPSAGFNSPTPTGILPAPQQPQSAQQQQISHHMLGPGSSIQMPPGSASHQPLGSATAQQHHMQDAYYRSSMGVSDAHHHHHTHQSPNMTPQMMSAVPIHSHPHHQQQAQSQQLNSIKLSELEFQEALEKNRIVSSTAISRAVQDASVGQYASAIETLATAISLIKQSKVSHDERCKILVNSLQDTKEGIENKYYGSSRGSSSSNMLTGMLSRGDSRDRDRER